jgi:hypothetical protein
MTTRPTDVAHMNTASVYASGERGTSTGISTWRKKILIPRTEVNERVLALSRKLGEAKSYMFSKLFFYKIIDMYI